ncbi:MAG: acyltransferase family protein [Sphaerospermopsis sp. SIO1G1]|nr:acyltransferase family protein [Sphaerospermopsis sp. SIO1G1]
MRLTSLDVFRGITIASMILVNMVGVTADKYPLLDHAAWNGYTPTDLVFPFFLFIVGVAMTFSLSKYTQENQPTKEVYLRILRRAAILFILGILLNVFWNQGVWTFDFSNVRLMGVLQRISLAYLFTSLIVLKLPRKNQWLLAGGLLIFYWLTMSFLPVPEYGAGNLTRVGNFGSFIDRFIIPKQHLYAWDDFNSMGDPEGLYSTMPAIVSVLIGYFTGEWIKNKKQPDSQTSMDLVLFGLCFLVIGVIWDVVFPINKKLWTSSYVLVSSGWALMLLAACYELIEVRLIKRWSKPFEIMGLNAIALFIASVMLIKVTAKIKLVAGDTTISIYNWIYENIFVSWAGTVNGSFLLGLVTVLLWYGVAVLMYQKKWFIKV